MKKRYYFVLAYLIFMLVLSINIYNTFKPKTLGEKNSNLYSSFDYYLNKIENNMNDVSTTSKWNKFKAIDSSDKKLLATYNSLLSDIKTCYLMYTDLDNEVYDNIKILSFKNKTKISDKELLKLRANKSCLEEFSKYNDEQLSDDQNISNKLKTQIGIIIEYLEEDNTGLSFDQLLYGELVNISKVSSLTSWLKVEYNSHL